MTTLLALPRELRDEILVIVLTTPTPPYIGPREHTGEQIGARGPEHVWYPAYTLASTAALPILLTCRQLRRETEELALPEAADYTMHASLGARPYREGSHHYMCQLYPTWTVVPRFANVVRTITVDFHMEHDIPRNVFRGGDGGPATLVWLFYHTLTHFIRVGPRGIVENAKDHHVCVRTLRIHVHPRHDEQDEQDDFTRRSRRAMDNRPLSARALAQFLDMQIRVLLYMGYHSAEYGATLYEHIGRLAIYVGESEMLAEYDLGLSKLDRTDEDNTFGHVERGKRAAAFAEWKSEAVQLREQRGLDTL